MLYTLRMTGLCIQTHFVSCMDYIHIIHAYEIKGYIHIIHAYGFTMVLWYKIHGFMIHLFLNKLREKEC